MRPAHGHHLGRWLSDCRPTPLLLRRMVDPSVPVTSFILIVTTVRQNQSLIRICSSSELCQVYDVLPLRVQIMSESFGCVLDFVRFFFRYYAIIFLIVISVTNWI
ncbi:hypothetical protein M6B38_408940 [Iris pallida]|uniref:Uncharacterized protein n=1 Tax=Iris pallida TaxID=29817 RepID=A0AAX6FN55_IRIPA|nr:hypothetical protein M6B38_408940 [Iris pallida]